VAQSPLNFTQRVESHEIRSPRGAGRMRFPCCRKHGACTRDDFTFHEFPVLAVHEQNVRAVALTSLTPFYRLARDILQYDRAQQHEVACFVLDQAERYRAVISTLNGEVARLHRFPGHQLGRKWSTGISDEGSHPTIGQGPRAKCVPFPEIPSAEIGSVSQNGMDDTGRKTEINAIRWFVSFRQNRGLCEGCLPQHFRVLLGAFHRARRATSGFLSSPILHPSELTVHGRSFVRTSAHV
jgi:hypothetical protein